MNSKNERFFEYCPGCVSGHFNLFLQDLTRLNVPVNVKSLLRTWLFHPGFRSVVAVRIMNHAYAKQRFRLALLLRTRNISNYGIDVFPGCRIESGLRIEHPVGIVIGRGVVIGKNVTLMHGVTLGQRDLRAQKLGPSPVLGHEVTVAAHACIFGAVSIPEGSFVRSKALVTEKDLTQVIFTVKKGS